ncbi:SAM-dependent methyltransferase [Aeoliella mucimassa]|uniref:Sarcosine/dimethylglycine N-methyltransferase n=1 Tax=Aeoliella mucimassa TaxID=2527972 RepID=A0A518AGS2_9BACT|nr:methyltransferase domain-containing protein [Aeoliella mucimassa]QDU53917.1 Sarcosine/dimethylglycine N-methyltransferase [Aeoliella mucimassa]
MSSSQNQAVTVARDYYNSDDADAFYALVWGGEDIHIGLYESENDSISDASHRTVRSMAERLGPLTEETCFLDIGSGFGGAVRHMAREYGCRATALNLSEVENQRNRKVNEKQGLADRIEVVDGNFEELPFEDAAFDVVWSQDAFLHSNRRDRVIAEAARVLKPGGQLVFTDPMQADDCPAGSLQPILDRLHLTSLASPSFYRSAAKEAGLTEVGFEDLTHQLVNHYASVLATTEANESQLTEQISADYLERMKAGLRHWVEGGRAGLLAWGVFHFRR